VSFKLHVDKINRLRNIIPLDVKVTVMNGGLNINLTSLFICEIMKGKLEKERRAFKVKVVVEDDKKHVGQICEKAESVFQLVGKKWITLIIHVLLDGPKRFGEIHSIIPDLSKRMLTERLKELEDCGIVLRNVITERPVRIEYSLTEKGTELGKALNTVAEWAEKWF
jgi:DNA-binding HxlR family transcriptional regulator